MKNLIVEVEGKAFVSHVDITATPKHTFDLSKIFDRGYSLFRHEVQRTGCAKLMGYRYDLRPYLKKFLYKQYGQWEECFAPSKTLLRKATYGAIDKIVELK